MVHALSMKRLVDQFNWPKVEQRRTGDFNMPFGRHSNLNRPTLLTLVAVTMRKGEWKGSTK